MTQNIIGERIAGLLMEQGKTQRELAEQVGTTEASISRYIKGDRVPKGTILANIAKALHTTTDYLLGNEKDSNDPELEYNYTQRAIARNANRWSKKQKLDLVNALFENDDRHYGGTKMVVEIKDGQIVGYSRIVKWAKQNNISYKVLSRMINNGAISKDNYFELEGLIFIKDSLVLPKELCIQRNNEGPKRIIVENLHKPCSKEQMMDEMEQVLGKDLLATIVLNTIARSDQINSYTDLAWWINNCWVEKYSSSEIFHQPVGKYIHGIGKRSWLLLACKIFNYHNEEVI